MKVVRKQFGKEGQLISKVVIDNDATNKYWNQLIERCRTKCEWTTLGMPRMIVWSNKVQLHTKTGHHFQFELIK
jgi:hypothetical protein